MANDKDKHLGNWGDAMPWPKDHKNAALPTMQCPLGEHFLVRPLTGKEIRETWLDAIGKYYEGRDDA